MVVSKLANELLLKITFFEVYTIISIWVKFHYFDIRGFVLKIEYTFRLVLMSGVQF